MPQSIDQSIFRKLLIRNVALPLFLALLTGGVFVGLIFFMIDTAKRVEHSDRVIAQTNYLQKLIIDAETGMRGYAITGDLIFLEPYNRALSLLPDQFNLVKNNVGDNPVQTGQIGAASDLFNKWLEYSNEVNGLTRKSKNQAQEIVIHARGKAIMDNLRALLSQFIQTEEGLRDQRSQNTINMIHIVFTIVVIFSLAVGLVIALMGRKQLLSLAENYEFSLRQQLKLNRELEAQKWIDDGRTELLQLMQTETRTLDIGQRILSFLVKYLGAQVGALHVANEQGIFESVTGYALVEGDLALQTRFQPGEGILGQAVKEKKIVRLSGLSDDFLKIKSSLGESKPQNILIVPCMSEQEPNAAVELGFLHEISERTIEFLSEAGVNVSNAVKSARYRERLEKLYREVQNQAEELQAQQEELRVNNEELEEQTKLLKEAQARTESQHAELEQTNTQLEEQAQELEKQKEFLSLQNEQLNNAQEALEAKAEELGKASQYKSEFLANMSHELRTPLNSSLILAKLLADNKEKNLTSKQVEFAEQIMSSGHDLLSLINDILDLSKVESGKLDIFAENFDVGSLVQSVEKVFQPIAREKALEFRVRIQEGLPNSLFSDRQRVEQILKNLLSNAFKFTARGFVDLSVEAGPGPDTVQITVSDSGIGIPRDQQDVIFEAFRQADGTTNRKFGGTGLGLSISRDLARLLGGRIEVESEPNVGSQFRLVLPIHYKTVNLESDVLRPERITRKRAKTPSEKTDKAMKTPALIVADDRDHVTERERLVLIIEDDVKFAQILLDLAHEQKFQAIVLGCAEGAMELAIDYKVQAILLDVNLPDHSGLFVLDNLKHNPKTRHIPVHVISGQDFTQQALKMGAIGYMLKPVKREELESAFHRLETKMSQNIKKVLVVEDDSGQREAITRLIGDNQIQITAVAYGKEALDALRAERFDCLVMDLSLPDMSGFELLEQLKNGEDFQAPPVIVYTGRDLSRQEEEKLRRHSQSLIIKGASSPDRLLNEVTLFLHKVESHLPPERQKQLEHLRSREKIFEGKTILIVDDDIRNVFALTAALEQKGAQVLIARDGLEALAKLTESVNMVLMDIMMPNMNGYEAMREIRKQEKFVKVPIIALTAKAMRDDRELCLKAGANDYLAKPVDVDKLLSLIRVWISYGEGR